MASLPTSETSTQLGDTAEYERILHEGFYVDVGEQDPFHILIDNAIEYVLLHSSASSVLCIVHANLGVPRVLKINWSLKKHSADTRGRIAADICSNVVRTPKLVDRQLYEFGDTYVMVVLREYIDGTPADKLWDYMNHDERDELVQQVSRAVMRIASHTSETFGAIQGRGLKSVCPTTYISNKVLLSKINHEIAPNDITILGESNFPLKAVLCHGNLTLDHIIVKNGNMVGIVGWSKADFVPEVYDRLGYVFKSSHDDAPTWKTAMADVPFSHPLPPTEFINYCVRYIFALHMRHASGQAITDLISTRARLLDPAMIVSSKDVGDVASLQSHTTIQEWDTWTNSSFDFDEACTSILGTDYTDITTKITNDATFSPVTPEF